MCVRVCVCVCGTGSAVTFSCCNAVGGVGGGSCVSWVRVDVLLLSGTGVVASTLPHRTPRPSACSITTNTTSHILC
jgi:hypothetical protein